MRDAGFRFIEQNRVIIACALCGRFEIHSALEIIAMVFQPGPAAFDIIPNYNIAPSLAVIIFLLSQVLRFTIELAPSLPFQPLPLFHVKSISESLGSCHTGRE